MFGLKYDKLRNQGKICQWFNLKITAQTRVMVSQAAVCDGLIYFVNYNRQNSNMQGYPLPLSED